jgi:thiopeptide-type bacteriocin biosynthesis protein
MAARYRHCGMALVRSTTDPGDLGIPSGLDPGDPAQVLGEGREWLGKIWARDDVRDAIALASPSLAGLADRILAAGTEPASTRDLQRVIMSTAAYLVRWQRRVTPFGLFAGVLAARTGPAAAVTGTAHKAVARADGDWVAALADALERNPGLRPRLTVAANNTAYVRDGRLLVASRAEPGTEMPGPHREASVRWTGPVQAAMETARVPVRLASLAGTLAARFRASPGAVSGLLDALTAQGFLLTSLRPPMTADDPVAFLTAALRSAGAHEVPEAAAVLRELEEISRQTSAHNRCADMAEAAAIRAALARRMHGLAPARSPLAVDVRLSGSVTIPAPVLEEAAAAAGALVRLTARPFGSTAWLEYHAKFRERYGPGTLVPVRELVADSGLGYPDGYLNTRRARPAHRALTERDAALLAMIQQATADGSDEITLTEARIRELLIDDHSRLVPPERAELAVTLHAVSTAAIGRGEFELRVAATPPVPTSMAGRFAHLLTAAERDQLARSYADSAPDPETMAVQLSFPPRKPRNENVTRVAPLAGRLLPLGDHPGNGDAVGLDDLAVTADAAQLYLVHRPTGRRVVPLIPHALDLKAQTPPLARFIAEVAAARSAGFGPFSLGAARVLPWVPRIRYRRTILAPARWLLSRNDLAGIAVPGGSGGWQQRLEYWRARWRVPARVIACQGELRLPLDLDQPLDRALLRARLERAGQMEIREDAPPEGNGWLGRPAELLIPLTLAGPACRPLPPAGAAGSVCRPGASPVVCAQIAGNPARFDDIIAFHLPALTARLGPGLVTRWWVRRYRNLVHPGTPQHVTLCLRLTGPDRFAEAAAEIAAFAAGLEARGLPGRLTLASYTEQPARYGYGQAMDAAEEVFAADTAAAAAQLALAASGVPAQVLAAASMARIAAAFGPDPVSGSKSLADCLDQGSGPLSRPYREQACILADPAAGPRELRGIPGGDAVTAAWEQRDAALAAYHAALSRQRDPGTVLRTLLHEHHMRGIGLDPDTERQTGRLARAAALRRVALAGRP